MCAKAKVVSESVESVDLTQFPKVKNIPHMRWAHTGWLPRLNVRQDYGSVRELEQTREELVNYGGWDPQYPPIAEPATESEIKEILQHRKALYDVLKQDDAKADLSKKDGEFAHLRLVAFERLYLDAKGNMIEPIALGTTGNRRGSMLVDVGARLLQEKGLDHKINDEILLLAPATADHRFPDPGVRAQFQVRENERKTAGFKAMTDEERLRTVQNLVQNFGKGQSDMRRDFGATLGLRLYYYVLIALFTVRQGWKKLRIMDRTLAWPFLDKDGKPSKSADDRERPNPDKLHFDRFDQFAFQGEKKEGPWKDVAMGLMCETDSKLQKANAERAKANPPKKELNRPNESLVAQWLNRHENDEGGGGAAPMMRRDQIQQFATNHASVPVQIAMKAVDTKNELLLMPLAERADGYNALYGISEKVYEALKPGLARFSDLKDADAIKIAKSFSDSVIEIVGIAEESKDEDEDEDEVPSPTEDETANAE